MLGDVHTTGVNWQSVGTILGGVAAIFALGMGRLDANRKAMRNEMAAEITKELTSLRERIAALEERNKMRQR
jgi:hypothetical protein